MFGQFFNITGGSGNSSRTNRNPAPREEWEHEDVPGAWMDYQLENVLLVHVPYGIYGMRGFWLSESDISLSLTHMACTCHFLDISACTSNRGFALE